MQYPLEHARRGVEALMRRGPEGLREHQVRVSPADLGGLARIGVAPESVPLAWRDLLARGLLDPVYARAQEAVDRALGSNPADWRVSLQPVPSSKWLRVEWRSGVRPGERWEPVR